MEYTYEFLRKCHGLRFKAERNGNDIEGIIKVEKDGIALFYGEETLDNFDYFHRECGVRLVSATGFDWRGITDFEIVPRDPDTYKDWQVGDVFISNDRKHIILFRCGEVVTYKERGSIYCSALYTCDELFNSGCRLVLTDIEKQIIEERKKEEWEPQDGDICFLKCPKKWLFIKRDGTPKSNAYACLCLSSGYLNYNRNPIITKDKSIEDLRPATDEEKQQLFNALARKGKRWNAEKKCLEDIPEPHEFKKFDPVLVRNGGNQDWKLRAFEGKSGDPEQPYVAIFDIGCYKYRDCIPYNEETKHLLGTTDDYEEGAR